MSDLRRHDPEVRRAFDPDLTGALPDVHVPGVSVEGWQAVLDLVVERGWPHTYLEGEVVLPVPRAATVLARPADAECPQLRVRPDPDVLVIFRFATADEIDFDVDLRELQGQERIDLFCDVLTSIGRRLGRPVLMNPEGGDRSWPLLGFDVEADRVVLMSGARER
ncbi:hypothetical protein [Streptomyces sp. Da 82-17]|uniref:hypothetical protein n=1 Tax=Streptomyces sp. Da 82-17 TaxID=3377116 RepID=UPI0038D42432